jgi:hypothetical protein
MIALEACKAVGAVMDDLEERNEMSETPLIREAADGNAKNVLLLLEAKADVDSPQMNNIGFTALNQAGYYTTHPHCVSWPPFANKTFIVSQRISATRNASCTCSNSGQRWIL